MCGRHGLWHGGGKMEAVAVIIGVIVLITLPIAYYGVARENTDIRVTRGRYSLTLIAIFILAMVLQGVAETSRSPALNMLSPFIVYGAQFYLLRLTVKRLRDAGRSRNYAYLCMVPFVGILACLVFCCIPSRGPSDSEIVKAF